MRKPVLAEAASLVAQMVKNLCTMQEMRVRSLGQEDPLEEEMATHSSVLAWSGLPFLSPMRARVLSRLSRV